MDDEITEVEDVKSAMEMQEIRTAMETLTRKPGDGASDAENTPPNAGIGYHDDEDTEKQPTKETSQESRLVKISRHRRVHNSPVSFEDVPDNGRVESGFKKSSWKKNSINSPVKMRDYSDREDDSDVDKQDQAKHRRKSEKDDQKNKRRPYLEKRRASRKDILKKGDQNDDDDDDDDDDDFQATGRVKMSSVVGSCLGNDDRMGRVSSNVNRKTQSTNSKSESPLRQSSLSPKRINNESPKKANSLMAQTATKSPSRDTDDESPSKSNSRLSPNMAETSREKRKIIKRLSLNMRQNESPLHGIEDPFRPSSRSPLLCDLQSSLVISAPTPTGSASPESKRSKSLTRLWSVGKSLTVKRMVTQKMKTETPEDDYDTDLEMDTSEDYNSRQKEHRMTISRQDTDIGHHSYEEACAKFGTTPLRRVLSQLWSNQMNLQHLGLNNNEMKALTVALMHNTRIEELDLDDNGLDGKCVTYVADLLKTNYFITKLNLNNNEIGDKGALIMSDTLKTTNWLSHLSLSGTHLGDGGMAYISAGLEENMTIRQLDLSHNNIGVNGGLLIGHLLGKNNTVELLDLGWNQIRLAGAVAVCKSLQKNKGLTKLNVSWNGLGFEGSLAVGEALKSNKVLATLDLTNNRINWECIPYIGRGLRVNKSLQVLELGLNPISMEGCDELLESVSKSTCGLTHLGLENIPINTEVAYKATEISRQRNFSLHHGGILSTSDVIGIQRAKKEEPFSLLIRYLSTMGIRVVDLFRMFQTESKLYVSKANFIAGLKRLRVPLEDDDFREVLKKIYISKNGSISYQSLAAAVRKQLRDDRKEDMKEERREQKRREERRRILRSDMPLIAPAERVFFPDIFTFYSSKVIQGTVDLQSPLQMNQSRGSSTNPTPSSVPLPKLSASPKNIFAFSDYDSWRHSPQTLVGSLVYEMQRSTPSRGQQKHGITAKDAKAKMMARKISD